MSVVRYSHETMQSLKTPIYASKIKSGKEIQLQAIKININNNLKPNEAVKVLQWDGAGKLLGIVSVTGYLMGKDDNYATSKGSFMLNPEENAIYYKHTNDSEAGIRLLLTLLIGYA